MLALHGFSEGPVDDLPFNPRRPGLDHIAFGCANRTELEAWARRLDDLGVGHGDIMDAGYGTGMAVTDPDGVALEIFCPPAG